LREGPVSCVKGLVLGPDLRRTHERDASRGVRDPDVRERQISDNRLGLWSWFRFI